MLRFACLALACLAAGLVALASPAAAVRSFPETGFSITNDRFQDYFDHRGGAGVLGFPISRELTLLGSRVQFLQRAVLQLHPDGSVGLLNILDDGLLPYTRMNGSNFPVANPLVARTAPSPEDPDYGEKALEFVRANAPDEWQGLKTNFFSTFATTVPLDSAFPEGGGESLLPMINLEIWGMPTSRPTRDPNNADFVYLRFQRGIMHFDAASGLTRGILIADYLKSLITGRDLPADLARDAWDSRLYRQYDNSAPNGVARPLQLADSNIFGAFEPDGAALPAPAPTPRPAATAAAPPVPVLATAAPPATPVPTPRPPEQPAEIAVAGSPWFVDQVRLALAMLATGAPERYAGVKRVVFRIEQTQASPSVDVAARTLRIDEESAFPSGWRVSTDNQAQWLAGLIVHNAVHLDQAISGRPSSGYEAELEAGEAQKEALTRVETTQPGGQFSAYLAELITRGVVIGCWERPRDPLPRR